MIATQRPAFVSLLAATLTLLVLSACTVTKPHRAPVEERSKPPAPSVVVAPPPQAKQLPIVEPPQATSYTVKPGDTLIRIALDQGVAWRDLARWNELDNPNLLEVGQVLRLAAPGANIGMQSKPIGAAKVDTKPLDAKTEPKGESKPDARVTTAASPSNPPPSAGASAPAAESDLTWAWPAQGAVQTAFDEQRSKGLSIAGKAGDAVLAAADGRVMYAGSDLVAYGNLVIIKHNDTFLSAYAHNQTLLVRDDQVVKRGQPIAEMGSSGTDQVKLHFEIRRKGKPIDPARLLPRR